MSDLSFTRYYLPFKQARVVALLLLLSMTLAACGESEFQDLKDFVQESGADLRGKVDPAPEIKPYEAFVYDNSAALPDPFKQRKVEVKNISGTGRNQPDVTRAKQELEEFPLEGMKMVGFLYKKGVANAVIRSSNGKLHRVKVGNYIGLNYGEITSITESELKVKEMVQDGSGDWVERESGLQIVE